MVALVSTLTTSLFITSRATRASPAGEYIEPVLAWWRLQAREHIHIADDPTQMPGVIDYEHAFEWGGEQRIDHLVHRRLFFHRRNFGPQNIGDGLLLKGKRRQGTGLSQGLC